MIQDCIAKVVERRDLGPEEMRAVWEEITGGQTTPAQIAGLITALRMKGETVEEITAAAQVMRSRATPIIAAPPGNSGAGETTPLLDTCGTGGDQTQTFNVSTCAALVAAGAGVRVAKHMNRSVSSSCGSADVCEALGINIHLSPEQTANCLRAHGIAFLFAPALHGTMKHAIGPRKEIGIRTIFNVLGPLSNPAGAQVQVLGVYHRDLTERIASVLGKLGSHRAMVVHGHNGMDEISTTGDTHVCEWTGAGLHTYTLHPATFGIAVSSLADLRGAGAHDNAQIILDILSGGQGARRDMVLMNAGAAIYTAGVADSMEEGIHRAGESIDSGAAATRLRALVNFTGSCT